MGILSTFGQTPGTPPDSNSRVSQPGRLLFDNCQLGTVLRAVVLVEAALAIGLLYSAPSPSNWLAQLALLTGLALPATLIWLLVGCACKTWLQNQSYALQTILGLLLGGACGLLATVALQHLQNLPVASPLPWLANGMSGLSLAGLLILHASLRRRAVIPENTAAQLRQLQERIQPHFLFNSLNSAIALVKKEPEKAETLLQDLSDLFRHALSKNTSFLRLDEELTLVRQYLAIEALRFGERMTVHWQIDPDTVHTHIAPLMLQPLVENAVRHGIEPSESPGQIWIRTLAQDRYIEMTVVNTVPPLAQTHNPGLGMGLHNVAQRLALFYDLEAKLEAKRVGDEYQVLIRIPQKAAMALTKKHSSLV